MADETTPNPRLLTDSPLVDPALDRLGRVSFARHLADAISQLEADDGFVLALNGAWGSGKTTLLNFVVSYLDKSVIVVWFNPWWFTGTDELLSQFFAELRAALETSDKASQLATLSSRLDAFARVLVPLKYVPGLGELAGAPSRALDVAARAVAGAADAQRRDLQSQRRQIDEALRSQDMQIVVVIDDLDRLLPEEMRQVLQLVKGVAGFPKTTYLLCYDSAAMKRSFEQLGIDADIFLEKIVQVAVDVPLVDRTQLHALFFEMLNELLKLTPEHLWDQGDWANLFLHSLSDLVATPRDATRLINALRLTYPHMAKDVYVPDFIAVQALRVFAPEMFEFVLRHKRLLTSDDVYDQSTATLDANKALFDKALGLVEERMQTAVRALINESFAGWDRSYASSWSRQVDLSSRRRFRVRIPEFFDRYFQLSLLPHDIDSATLDQLVHLAVTNPEDFLAEFSRMAEDKQAGNVSRARIFLERLRDRLDQVPSEEAVSLLKGMIEIPQVALSREDRRGLLDFGMEGYVDNATYQLTKRIEKQQRYIELARLTRSKNVNLRTLEGLIGALAQEHGRFGHEIPLAVQERALDEPQMDALQKRLLDRLLREIRSADFLDSGEILRTLYYVRELGGVNEVFERTHKWIQRRKSLAAFLAGCLSKVYSESSEGLKADWTISISSVKGVLTEDDYRRVIGSAQRLSKKPPDWLSEQKRMALATLLAEDSSPSRFNR